ncbi:Crp/Fnr family transcriptional regulator [Oscillibacter sp. 1-3]|uniref:Crp/Fnr family transcriptional regulator n=1 Tax=Oscillibacter sp. 1-3 TaxID=1235797 RepID=UPI0018CA5C96|nr:Crp/Fnr family transcriptional regulator [Oscillibacter sp. 1-3]
MKAKEANAMRYIPDLFRQYGLPRRFCAGQQIFLKDSPARELYFLERGKVRAYLLYPDGIERTLCFVEKGNLVGEEAVGRPAVRIVCADAAADSLMYSMDLDTLLRACAAERENWAELLALFMKKIELLSSWIFYAQFIQNSAKLACFLFSNTGNAHTVVRYTQEQIAAVTGMSRVSVSNLIRKFEEEGLVCQGYRSIRVLDRERLRALFGKREFY